MRVNAKGSIFDAVVKNENGADVGYGSLQKLLAAFGVPVVGLALGDRLVPLRRFCEAFGVPLVYSQADNCLYIASRPLPPLPAEPVGAGVDPWRPVTAPICGGPGDRRADLLERIIAQFQVTTNPRYAVRDTSGDGEPDTHCDAFVCDVTAALGAPIPFWVIGDGEPSAPGKGRELSANGSIQWLHTRGRDYDWRTAKVDGAMAAANNGMPVVAAYYNHRGIGHVAIVRPGTPHLERGLPIAQAGARNFDDGYLIDGFGTRAPAVEYFVHM